MIRSLTGLKTVPLEKVRPGTQENYKRVLKNGERIKDCVIPQGPSGNWKTKDPDVKR